VCLLKKIAIQCGFVIAFLCSFQAVVNAASVFEQLNSNSVKRDQSESICYLPTESNVRYQDVLALPTESPKHVLSYGAQQFQFGELWLPNDNRVENRKIESSDPLIRHPLVVLVHGGCWLNSFDIKHTHALSTALKGAGYAVWSLEYRRTGDAGGGWPGTYADIKLAIEYLPELADFPVDLNKIAIAGHSAGGHLALLAASEQIYDFDAVIGLASIVDIERYALGDNSCQVATPAFMGGSFETKASTLHRHPILMSRLKLLKVQDISICCIQELNLIKPYSKNWLERLNKAG